MSDEQQHEGMPFSAFVLTLGTSALAALGQCDDPVFMDCPRDPEVARTNIDVLLMLRDKTKGNLSLEEDKLLSSIIYDLQMRYVQATKE